MAGRAQKLTTSASLPQRFSSNHVLFCWELPPGVSHLPTSFLPRCQGNAVTRSHNALQLPSVRKHCEHMAFKKIKIKLRNKSEIYLYYEMLYVNADRRCGSWGVKSLWRQMTPLDILNFAFVVTDGACFHMQTCVNWDLKLFIVMVTKVKLFNHHSSERRSTATTCNSMKLDAIIIHLTNRKYEIFAFFESLSTREEFFDVLNFFFSHTWLPRQMLFSCKCIY